MTYRSLSGTVLGSVTEDTNAAQASIVAVGFNRNGIPPNTDIIDVSFGSTPPHPSFRIRLDGCCCNDNDCAKNIYFQSRWGGYDVMAMGCLSGRQVIQEHQEYTQAIDCLASFSDKRKTGERKMNSKQIDSQLIFQKDFDLDCFDSRYLDDMIYSNNYFIKDYDINGDPYLARFIVTAGQQTTYSSRDVVTLTISGKYSNRLLMPY